MKTVDTKSEAFEIAKQIQDGNRRGTIITTDRYFGEEVYLKSDQDQIPRHIIGMCLKPSGELQFEIAGVGVADWCYEFQFTTEKRY